MDELVLTKSDLISNQEEFVNFHSNTTIQKENSSLNRRLSSVVKNYEHQLLERDIEYQTDLVF